MKKPNWNSKGFVTLVACLCLAAGAVTMVALTQNKNKQQAAPSTTAATEVRAEVKGIKGTTKHEVTTSTAPSTTAPAAISETEPASMAAGDNNVPYESYFMYPLNEVAKKAYSGGNLVYSETMGDYRSHNGTDFQGSEGDTVKAVTDGIVLSVTKDELWGNCVEIDHGHNMVVKYCGFKTTTAEKGQTLKQGDSIGTLGTIPIEAADGCHLHLEIKIDGKFVNPMEAMNKVSGEDAEKE